MTTIAQTGPDVKIFPHGTLLGLVLPPEALLISFSMYCLSSILILGCSAGESKTTKNQVMDQTRPTIPARKDFNFKLNSVARDVVRHA